VARAAVIVLEMQAITRRILVDLIGLGLLIGPIYLHLLPFTDSLLVLLSVPTLVGIARGLAETHFLGGIPRWIAALEWGLVVFAADLILCIPDPKTDLNTNYWTIFGAFFVIFILPSVPLSIGGFMAAVTLQTDRRV
jgi:hypothetical protein